MKTILHFAGRRKLSILLAVCLLITVIVPTKAFSANEMQVDAHAVSANETKDASKTEKKIEKSSVLEKDTEELEVIETDTDALEPVQKSAQNPVPKAAVKKSVSGGELGAETANPPLETSSGGKLVSSVHLYKGDNTEILPTEPAELANLDRLTVRVDFQSPLDFSTEFNDETTAVIQTGVAYELMTIPEQVDISQVTEWVVTYDDGREGDDPTLGVAKIQNGMLTFTFDAGVAEKRIGDAYISFSAVFDGSGYQGTYEKEAEFVYGSDSTTFTLQNEAFKPVDPSLEKSGRYIEEDNQIEWTITVKGAQNQTDYPDIYIEDMISTVRGEYVEGSMKLGTEAYTHVELYFDSGIYLDWSERGWKLKIGPMSAEGDKKFTYRTQCEPVKWLNANGQLQFHQQDLSAKNKAQLYRNDSKDKIGTVVRAEVPLGGSITWMSKTGEAVKEIPGVTKWTVTVDTSGYDFENIVIYDKIANFNPDVDPDSPNQPAISYIVSDTRGYEPTITTESGTQATLSAVAVNGADYDAKFHILNNLATNNRVNGKYTITYYTEISNFDEYCKYNQSNVVNNAWMEFDWPNYAGTTETKHATGPVLSKYVYMTAGSIKKSDGTYNKQTHEMEWTITVNEAQVAMSNVKVYDYIAQHTENAAYEGDDIPQEFVAVKSVKIGPKGSLVDATSAVVDNGKVTTQDSGKTVVIDLENRLQGGSMAEIVIVTKLTDPDYYESNHYTNSAGYNQPRTTFYNNAQVEVGGIKRSSDYGACTPEIHVLEKQAETYDYSKHTLSWSITVDRDEMALSNVIVTDILAEGTSLVTDTLKLNSSVISDSATASGMIPYYTYEEATRELKVYLGDISAMQKLTFDTLVDVEHSDFGEGKNFMQTNKESSADPDITITNTVNMTKDGSEEITDVPAVLGIPNTILKKTCDVNQAQRTATYTVKINQAMNQLSNETLTDTMSAGLRLKPASIKLYKATVTKEGNLTYNAATDLVTEADYGDKSAKITTTILSEGSDAGKTQMTVPLPDGKNAYVLTYQAQVSDADSDTYAAIGYSNSVSLSKGQTQTVDAENNVLYSSIVANGGGGMAYDPSYFVKVVKNAAEDETKLLAGATFQLRQKVGDTEFIMGEKTTDASGEVYFSGLDGNTEYMIEEMSAPSGYTLPEQTVQTVTTGADAGRANAVLVTFSNTKIPLSFKKVDEKGSALAGAEFGLYSVSETRTEGSVSENGLYETFVESQTSDTTGKVSFVLATDGTYRIKETKAPTGYDKTNKVYIAVVENNLLSVLYEEGDTTQAQVSEIVNTPTKSEETNTPPTTEPEKPSNPPSVSGNETPPTNPPTNAEPEQPTDEEEEDGEEEEEEEEEEDDDADASGKEKDDDDQTTSGAGTDAGGSNSASQGTLPKTGREARALFYLLGAALIGAGCMLYKRRKKETVVTK